MSASEVLTAIHRGPEAVINIEGPHGAWVEGNERREWRVLASGTADSLLSCRILEPWLRGEQVYFSLSSVYPSHRAWRSEVTGLPVYSRAHLRYLNVVCTDIDIAHAAGSSFDFDFQAQQVLDFTMRAGFPHPTLLSDSGRGIWLFWLLKDRLDEQQPLCAYRNLQAFHSRLLSAAVAAYQKFNSGADSSCTDSQRVARFPGSLNAKSGTPARYFRISDKIFSLPELANAFGVRPQKTSISVDAPTVSECTGKPDCKCGGVRYSTAGKPKRPVCLTQRARAGVTRWRVPLAGIRQLAEIRGRFKKGCQHNAIYLFAAIGKRARLSNLHSETARFAATYCPALSHSEVKRCIRSARKSWKHISNRTIIKMLRVTHAEKTQLTSWFKNPAPTKRAQIAFRRDILAAEIALRGSLSIRMAVFVLSKYGITSSRSRIAEDLKHLRTKRRIDSQKVCLSVVAPPTQPPKPYLQVQAKKNGTA
jgi:hypothetical protein